MRFLIFFTLFFSCTSAEIAQVAGSILQSQGPVTETEMKLGLKEALSNGLITAVMNNSKKDGYFKNSLIKIPFPEKAKMIKTTLDSLGMKSLTNKVTLSLNRAAEHAAIKAKPIFKSAISQLTFSDVLNIVQSNSPAATDFLKRTTSSQLMRAFSPEIQKSLNAVHATKYWTDVIGEYNKIPIVEKVNPDLNQYVTQLAINGLFKEIAKKEMGIRKNPAERTSQLLKRVFGQM